MSPATPRCGQLQSSSVRRSTIPVVLLAALSFFAGLGRGAIADTDEAFYAESAREMVESGDWLTPHFNYEPRFQKPALYYWLTAALVCRGTGRHEFSARLWSALAGVGLVLRHDRVRAPLVRRERRDCSPARSPRPASATSRSRAWRCPICRSRSSSRWRSGRRLSRRSSASATRAAGCCSRPRRRRSAS